MVVHKKDRKKAAIRKKIAWALTASLVATPGVLGAEQGAELNPSALAAGKPREMVIYKGQTSEIAGLSFHNHKIEVSSDALVLDDAEGKVTLQAQHAGTYTVYVYELDEELETLLDEIRVTVKSHRIEADTDGDGLIDISDIIAYLKMNHEVDLNHDGVFDHLDVQEMLGWIDSKYAERFQNRAPQFIEDPSTRHWLELPQSEEPKPYEPKPIPLDDFFVDLDGDHLSYHIQSVSSEEYADFKIVQNELHYMTREPEANTHDITVVTIRATDELGAHHDGQFTIERNVPPQFLNGEAEVVDLGVHYWEIEGLRFNFTPIVLNLDEYFIDPNGDPLTYDEPRIVEGDFIILESGEDPSEIVIDLASGANMELKLDVTAEDPFGNTNSGTFTATIRVKP